MNNYLVVNNEGHVVNIIVWDGISPYDPGDDTLYPCVDHPGVGFGWCRVEDSWLAPEAEDTPSILNYDIPDVNE